MLNDVNIELTDTNFTPHMTLMKLSNAKWLRKIGKNILPGFMLIYKRILLICLKGIKKIDLQHYELHKEEKFGDELIDSVHFCSITQKQDDGFYKIENSLNLHENQTKPNET